MSNYSGDILLILCCIIAAVIILKVIFYIAPFSDKTSPIGTITITELGNDDYTIHLNAPKNLPDLPDGAIVKFRVSHKFQGS